MQNDSNEVQCAFKLFLDIQIYKIALNFIMYQSKLVQILHYLIRASMVLVNFFGNNIDDVPGGFEIFT